MNILTLLVFQTHLFCEQQKVSFARKKFVVSDWSNERVINSSGQWFVKNNNFILVFSFYCNWNFSENSLPSVIDFEHFIDNFLALLSNHDPSFWPPVDKDEKVFDFCITFKSILSPTSIATMAN